MAAKHMHFIHHLSEPAKDWLAAGVAAGVPTTAWLANLNVYLTTFSLIIAIAIGLARLWRHFRPVMK